MEYFVLVFLILIPAGLNLYLAVKRGQLALLGVALVISLIGWGFFQRWEQRHWKSGGS